MDRSPTTTHAWPAPVAAPPARPVPAGPVGGTVLHRFFRGRRWYSVVVYPDTVVVVTTTPGFGGLLGLALRALVSARRRHRLARVAPQGPAAVAAAFRSAEVIDLRTVPYVQLRSGLLRQRVLVIHRQGLEPVSLPFPRDAHTVSGLWQVFGPVVGARFVIDHDVRVEG